MTTHLYQIDLSVKLDLWYNYPMATEDKRTIGAPENPGERVTGDHAIDTGTAVTAQRALKLLQGGKTAEVAGQKITSPEQAYANLKEALALVRKYFGDKLKIDLTDLQFRKFQGDIVGEATTEATLIDPIMLMHPAVRLAHVIAHELAHDNRKILNEGLVESYVHLFFGEDGTEHGYTQAVEDFSEFAGRFAGKGDLNASVQKLYELYYAGDFEAIYEGYEQNYINELKTEAEQDEAFLFFRQVFPELEYSSEEHPGQSCLKTFATGQALKQELKPGLAA